MSTEVLLPPTEAIDIDIGDLDQEFETLTPTERIERAVELFAGELVVATSFGPTSAVMLDKVADAAPGMRVVNIRTHHEPLRTLELSELYKQEFDDLEFRVYDAPVIPVPLEGTTAFAEFQHRVKVEPFQGMLYEEQPRAYLSGVMRWQSPERADLPVVQDKGSAIAINPIVDLSRAAVERFFKETGLPRDDHYFDPTKGRGQKLECGLNSTVYKNREE